jgi:hypothetical protein
MTVGGVPEAEQSRAGGWKGPDVIPRPSESSHEHSYALSMHNVYSFVCKANPGWGDSMNPVDRTAGRQQPRNSVLTSVPNGA